MTYFYDKILIKNCNKIIVNVNKISLHKYFNIKVMAEWSQQYQGNFRRRFTVGSFFAARLLVSDAFASLSTFGLRC